MRRVQIKRVHCIHFINLKPKLGEFGHNFLPKNDHIKIFELFTQKRFIFQKKKLFNKVTRGYCVIVPNKFKYCE